MRIVHTADWHLGDRLGRVDRTGDLRRAVERVARYCDEESADVLLVAGDLFSELSRADTLRESIEHLQGVFECFLRKSGTVLALTGNHDSENFCRMLRHAMALAAPSSSATTGDLLTPGRFYLASQPTLVRLLDRDARPVQFLLMPYPTASSYLDAPAQTYRDAAERNRAITRAFRNKLKELQEHRAFLARVPTILAAHIHVEGARLPRLMPDCRESIHLRQRDLPGRFAYGALGHVHCPQSLRRWPHFRYSGSIERLDLGEQDDIKSLALVEIGPDGRRGEPVCLPMDATPFHDVHIVHPREELPRLRDRYPDADRALVRYRVSFRAGEDNLEEILRELDRTFPRWYAREWQEASSNQQLLSPTTQAQLAEGMRDVVLGYLRGQLTAHPDRDAILGLAGDLLAEEGA